MEWIPVALVAGLAIVLVARAARALATGAVADGERRHERRSEPAEYWFAILSGFGWLLLSAAAAWGLTRDEAGRARFDAVDLLSACYGLTLAFWLARFLWTGTARFAGSAFSRAEEPRQYWLLTAASAALAGLCLWLGLGRPGA